MSDIYNAAAEPEDNESEPTVAPYDATDSDNLDTIPTSTTLPGQAMTIDFAARAEHAKTKFRIIDPDAQIRPATLNDIIGQVEIKDQLRVAIRAARGQSRALDHTLLTGPPGLGKTTIASVIAHSMDHHLLYLSGPAVGPNEMMSLIAKLITRGPGENIVVFIDEIHKMHKDAQTIALPLMEDFRHEELILETPFTLLGATTDPSKLDRPLRDRFGMTFHLDFYPDDDIANIIRRTYGLMTSTPISEVRRMCEPVARWMQPGPNQPRKLMAIPTEFAAAIDMLAARARGVPRIANRLMRRTLDYMYDEADNDDHRPTLITADGDELQRESNFAPLTPAIVRRTMRALSIDVNGLEKIDRQYLEVLAIRYKGRPAGVKAIAAALGESSATLEETVEPNLVRRGFINRTSTGRQVTPEGMTIAVKQHTNSTDF